MSETNMGQKMIQQLVENLGLDISGGLALFLGARFQDMYDGGFFGNNQIAFVLLGNATIKNQLEASGINTSTPLELGSKVGEAKDDLENGEVEQIVVSAAELANYSNENPFDASEGAFRFEFDASDGVPEDEKPDTAIINFSDDDTLYFANSPTGEEGDFNVRNFDWDDGEAILWVGELEINLLGLDDDWFSNASSFKDIYGDDALVFA